MSLGGGGGRGGDEAPEERLLYSCSLTTPEEAGDGGAGVMRQSTEYYLHGVFRVFVLSFPLIIIIVHLLYFFISPPSLN